MTRLVLATANQGKVRELQALLPLGIPVVTAVDLGVAIPAETGSTLEENARIKALGVSLSTPDLVLSDDSGLSVDALDGEPGVRSARFAGEPPSDAANVAKVLERLGDRPAHQRAAQFRCVLCLARGGTVLAEALGHVTGEIATAARGSGGFGYDPIFIVDGGRTMAELDPGEKSRISHRADALRRMLPHLREHLGASDEGSHR